MRMKTKEGSGESKLNFYKTNCRINAPEQNGSKEAGKEQGCIASITQRVPLRANRERERERNLIKMQDWRTREREDG